MSNAQLSRAVDAAYDCIKELKSICEDLIDSKDVRVQAIELSLDRLATILYVEPNEND